MAQLPKLTTPKRIVAWRLSECRPVSLGELIDALYGDDPDGGPDEAVTSVYAYVHRLRNDFAAVGIQIERGQSRLGWRVDPKHHEALRSLLAQEIATYGERFLPVDGRGPNPRRSPAAVSVPDSSVSAVVDRVATGAQTA